MSSKVTAAEPKPLPSPPPSPSPSPTLMEQDANNTYLTPGSPTADKGKGRMMDTSTDSQQSDQDDDSDGYPTDEMETKRIEENLRRWEMEERERRRIARESGSSSKYSVRGATRTASLIWAGLRSQRPRSGGTGGHHVIPDNENEDGVPLEDLDRTPPPSGANTPTMKQHFNTSPPRSSTSTINNPFRDPNNVLNASTSSLNTPDHDAILSESSEFPPILQDSPVAAQKRRKGPPPPLPLGLPKPRTPPPRDDQDQEYISEPPDLSPTLSITPRGVDNHDPVEPEKETKWWTEWLCGCSEGPDRGGFNQSGRTNPNE